MIEKFAKEAEYEINEGAMPLTPYTRTHSGVDLNDEEKAVMIEWLNNVGY